MYSVRSSAINFPHQFSLFLIALICAVLIVPFSASAQDVTPPDVSITSGVSADATYDLRADVTDQDSGVATVRYYLDDDHAGVLSDGGDDTFSATVDTSDLPEGDHVIHVRAKDNDGNWNNDSSVAVTVDHDTPAKLVITDFHTDRTATEGVRQGKKALMTFTLQNTGDEDVEPGDLTYSITVDDAEGIKKPKNTIVEDLVWQKRIAAGDEVTITYEWDAVIETGPKLVGMIMVYNDGETTDKQFAEIGVYVHDIDAEENDTPAPGAAPLLVVLCIGAIMFRRSVYAKRP